MKARKKPVVIDCFKWTGDRLQKEGPRWIVEALIDGTVVIPTNSPLRMEINTLEGVMTASHGDYIIKGVNGEIYPCKPDIFDKTYEVIE